MCRRHDQSCEKCEMCNGCERCEQCNRCNEWMTATRRTACVEPERLAGRGTVRTLAPSAPLALLAPTAPLAPIALFAPLAPIALGRLRELVFEVIDSFQQAFFEADLRFPTEQRAGARDVGTALFRVVHGQRPVDELAARSDQPDDRSRNLFDGHFLRIADVHRLV